MMRFVQMALLRFALGYTGIEIRDVPVHVLQQLLRILDKNKFPYDTNTMKTILHP